MIIEGGYRRARVIVLSPTRKNDVGTMLDVVRTVCDQRASYADVGPVFRHWLETLPWYRLELIEGPGGGPIAVADESPVWGLGAPGSDVVPFPRVELDVDQRKAHNVTCAET